jgi:Domain of unknown function (DUF4253)
MNTGASVGKVPAAGSPEVAGQVLPPGRPLKAFEGSRAVMWSSDAVLENPFPLADTLARAFPQTGLWPLLWAWQQEQASAYADSHAIAGPRAIDRLIPARILAVRWTQLFAGEPVPAWAAPFTRTPPGLAPAQSLAGVDASSPFATLARRRAYFRTHYVHVEPLRLLLVPCLHPADAIASIGWAGPIEGIDAPGVAAVARTWATRFCAVPVMLSPSTLTFAVAAPPTNARQALLLAAEHSAVSDVEEGGIDHGIRIYAEGLRHGLPETSPLMISASPRVWELGWS